MVDLSKQDKKLLEGWEEVFKKGQLTLWIMLALKDGEKHMSDIKEFIHESTNQVLSADDQSMYRALRRYNIADLVEYKQVPGTNGPDLKIYNLTESGRKILDSFVDRNIIGVFYKPNIKELLERSN